MEDGSGLGIIGLILYLALIAFFIAVGWKIFTKAGKPGWAAIVPIYNLIVTMEIVGRPAWWVVLMLIPLVNLVVAILVSIDLAKSFGKSAGFGIGLAFLGIIFAPILAFGDAQYQGPAAATGMTPAL
jgi:Na+/glutamate symporter